MLAERPLLTSSALMAEQDIRQCVRSWFCVAPTLLAVVAATSIILVFAQAVQGQQPDGIEARVSKILDGDTFTLSGESRRIRVWGLDAPEWDQRGGSAATSTLRSLISSSTLRCDILDIDRYGRLVARCVLPDGRDIAAAMIRSGAAAEYCRFSRGYYGTC